MHVLETGTMFNIVGAAIATASVGFIAVYYLLASPSRRYFGRLFSKRSETEGKEKSIALVEGEDGVSKDSTHPETKANGAVPHTTEAEHGTPNGEPTVNSLRVSRRSRRNGTILNDFERFAGHDMIMKFEEQRQVKFQFFVVVLASDEDLQNLGRGVTYHPHIPSLPQQPLIDNRCLIMPSSAAEYGNYLVARFESCAYHSEEVLFGPKYDSPFSQLWSAYVKNEGSVPNAVLLYSWNFPCGRCTELITRVLSQEQYSGTRVMLAYSRIWDSEEGYPHVADKNMSSMRERIGAHIQQVEPPTPLQKAGVPT